MKIEIEQLDKQKTYVLGIVGTGIVSRLIQDMSDSDTIELRSRLSHVACLHFNGDYGWRVIEAHAESGTVELDYILWYKNNHKNTILIFEHTLDLSIGKAYVKNKTKYSIRDIAQFGLSEIGSWLHFVDRKRDRDGVVCSELIAKMDTSNVINRYVAKYHHERVAEDHEIKPNDFLEYAVFSGHDAWRLI